MQYLAQATVPLFQYPLFLVFMMPPLVYFFCVFEYVLLHNNLFKLYFIDYAITVVLIFPPLPPSTQHPYSLRQSPHHCSCPWVMHISFSATTFPRLYFTSLWLFCNYSVPSPLLPFSPSPLPSGNHLITNFFSLGASESLSISLIFGLLMMMCLGVGLLASFLSGTLYFLDLHVYFRHEIREVFCHYFSNRLPISCSFSSPSGTPMM